MFFSAQHPLFSLLVGFFSFMISRKKARKIFTKLHAIITDCLFILPHFCPSSIPHLIKFTVFPSLSFDLGLHLLISTLAHNLVQKRVKTIPSRDLCAPKMSHFHILRNPLSLPILIISLDEKRWSLILLIYESKGSVTSSIH